MMSLIKIAELVIIFFVIRSFIKMILPGAQKSPPEKKPDEPPKRFDDDSHDISDGDYEEM